MISNYKRFQEGVIRSILARPDEMVNIIDHVNSTDFEDVNFKMVYEAMLDIFIEGKPISLPEITLKIGEKGGSVNPGWLFNLESNMVQWVQQAPPSTWAKLLKRESSKNRAIEVLKEGIESMNDNSKDPLALMDKVSTKLTEVSVEATSGDKFSIKESIQKFREDTVRLQKTDGTVVAISSAYPSIDSYTKGWAPTHLITVGARTGIGKSVFAINNAVAAMQQGKSVLFFSLEMTEREVISRIVSSLSMVPIHKIEKAHALTDDEQQRVDEALEFIANSKLTIDTEPHVTIEYLKRLSVKQAQSEEGLDFIIIDYLQLIENSGKQNRQEAVSEVSRSVKILAKTLNVPIMVLVQVNREKREEESDQPPKLHDIRESGAIAQDSNIVILIHRNMEEDAETIDPKALFILAKNRQGESNKFLSVRTRLDCSLFIDDSERAQKLLREKEEAVNNSMQNNSMNDEEFVGLFEEKEGFADDSTHVSYSSSENPLESNEQITNYNQNTDDFGFETNNETYENPFEEYEQGNVDLMFDEEFTLDPDDIN